MKSSLLLLLAVAATALDAQTSARELGERYQRTRADDPVAGLMETPEGTIRYDPDRGQRLIDTVH